MLVEEYLKEAFPFVQVVHCWLLKEAKESLCSQNYDLILLDLTLPDSEGKISIIEIIELAKGIPVVVLTGFGDRQFAVDTMQLGVQDYLIKDDVTPTVLQKSVSYSIERNKIQQLVLINEKKFRAIFENSTDGYALVNSDGLVLELSPYGREIIGKDAINDSGLFRFELIHPDQLKTVARAFLEVIKKPDEIKRIEFKYNKPDTGTRWLESTFYNLLSDPFVGAIVLNFRDITSRKNEEEERGQLIEELIQSNADLKQFGYITSHNLRAPLTNLLAIVELLDTKKITDPQTMELLSAFKTATFQLNDTLNDVLKVLFIRENKYLALNEISFQQTIDKNIHALRELINSSSIRIQTDFSAAPSIWFDENYLESILLNLLTNSIKFASRNRTLQININTTRIGDDTVLEFSDNGIGMNMEKVKDRIFGLYQRFHDRPDSKGIGLYLIHAQLKALGGSISVKSEVDGGTTFSVNFKNVQQEK